MPGLDYKGGVPGQTGAFARSWSSSAPSFYDGSPGRELITCPDCNRPADALFGDHGGDCLVLVKVATPKSALGIVRAHALRHERFSANDLRSAFEQAGVAPTSRGPAMVLAVKKEWVEVDGMVASTGAKTKKHRVQTYRSLIVGKHIQKDTRS